MELFWENLKQQLNIQKMDERTYSPLALAFIGDSVYDLLIRTMVVSQGNRSPQKLHKDVREYVKATYQASIIEKLEPILSEEELSVYKAR
jgi:ribonuclease III family protein